MPRLVSRKQWFVFAGSLIAGSLLLGGAPASSVTLGFDCVTNNLAANCAIGEAQVTVEVTDPGGGQIAFTFRNVGANPSSITDVYWDDGTLASIISITSSAGVNFAEDATPGNLPGGNNAIPPFVASFSADSQAPAPLNGVNPGETLTVTFALIGGQTFANAIQDLTDGDLRVGVHVQSIGANAGSEGFVNIPIPEPGTLALVGTGLLGLAIAGRRRS